jgi:hypothetical protein
MLARILVATLAGGAAIFVFGFIIYGIILEPVVMKPNLVDYPGLINEMPVWGPMIAANIVSAFLLAYVFDQWAGIRSFVGGLKAGAILWFLITLSHQLMFVSMMNLHKSMTPVIADVIGATMLGAIAGGVIGLVLGMMSKDATPAAG